MRAASRGGQSGSGGGRAPCEGTRQFARIKHNRTCNVVGVFSWRLSSQLLHQLLHPLHLI